MIERIRLKGGSLSATELLSFSDGRKAVRKSVSRNEDREYGLVRWHSQMKRLQRYQNLVPELFPRLLDVSIENDLAYFDIEYIEHCTDLKLYLTEEPRSKAEVEVAWQALEAALERLHSLASFPKNNSLLLYFEEEVRTKLNHARLHKEFDHFYNNPEYILNGQSVPGLHSLIDDIANLVKSIAPPNECYTHGNVTLENVLFVPSTGRIIFVDPYDENIVDCAEAEYSQILQCSNCHYGFINDRTVHIDGNSASFAPQIPESLKYFNSLFLGSLEKRLSGEQLLLTRFFEFSQFVRMLPFKVAANDLDKAKYFLCLASHLGSKLVSDTNLIGE